MRAFLAIQVPEGVRSAMIQVQEHIESSAPGFFSWSRPEQLHLTLYFLGQIEGQAQGVLQSSLCAVQSAPFELSVNGLLFFPAQNVPKVIAAGVSGEVEPLRRLQQRIADTVFPVSQFKETRGFSPHVTIGRLKRGMPGTAKVLKRTLASVAMKPTESFVVNEYELVKSSLEPGGSRYETLLRFPLN